MEIVKGDHGDLPFRTRAEDVMSHRSWRGTKIVWPLKLNVYRHISKQVFIGQFIRKFVSDGVKF